MDIPQDDLHTCRNMHHVSEGKQIELKYTCFVLDSVSAVYLVMNAMGWLP